MAFNGSRRNWALASSVESSARTPGPTDRPREFDAPQSLSELYTFFAECRRTFPFVCFESIMAFKPIDAHDLMGGFIGFGRVHVHNLGIRRPVTNSGHMTIRKPTKILFCLQCAPKRRCDLITPKFSNFAAWVLLVCWCVHRANPLIFLNGLMVMPYEGQPPEFS